MPDEARKQLYLQNVFNEVRLSKLQVRSSRVRERACECVCVGCAFGYGHVWLSYSRAMCKYSVRTARMVQSGFKNEERVRVHCEPIWVAFCFQVQ